MGTCGMYTCKSCGIFNIVFGILFLIAGTGIWANTPNWFNGWTILGVYVLLWGIMSGVIGKEH